HEVMLVSGRRQLRFVVHFAFEGGGAEVEGISGGKANFDYAAIILQRVSAVGQKLPSEKNVAGGSLRPDVIGAQIEQAEIATDRRGFNSPGAARACERAAHGLDGEVARGVFEVHASGDGFDVHIAEHVCDADVASIIVNLQLGVFRDVDLKIGAHVVWRNGVGKFARGNVHAIAHLLGVHFDAIAGRRGNHHYFGFGPGLDGNEAVGIVNGDDRMSSDFEMLFLAAGTGSDGATEQQA